MSPSMSRRRVRRPDVLSPPLPVRLLSFTLLVLAVAAPGLGAQAVPADAVYPGEEWESLDGDREALAAYGWDARGLRQAWAFLRDSANTTGAVVVDRGRVVLEFGDIEDLSYLASVRKSVLAMLYGEWVENGTIDLEATLADIGMDDVGGLLPIEKRATVHHLITARSGVYHPASNSGDNLADAPERGSQEPGAYMLYSNWDFNAAGAAFEKLTGRNIYDELERQLAGPLDFEDWDRSAQRKSGNLEVSVNPAYHMWLSTRDMARIGYLMLREGRWEDEQIVSPEWVRRIAGVVTPLGEMNPVGRRDGYFGYGYMWWVFDGPRATGPFEGAYTARGAWGQWITVLPAVDLVIAHKTNSVYGRTTSWQSWQRFLELVLQAKDGVDTGSWPWDGADDGDAETAIDRVLTDFHDAASDADLDRYFGHMTEDAVFIGTDAGERWTRDEFLGYVRPYFSQGRGWTYTSTTRNIDVAPDGGTAWFDELLDNEAYGVTRGTGVLLREGDGAWRIAQYHLTIPVPNALARDVVEMIRREGG